MVVFISDTVFKLTEPLKQWTDKLFDHYEEGLLIEGMIQNIVHKYSN
jgi:hypothetical protein